MTRAAMTALGCVAAAATLACGTRSGLRPWQRPADPEASTIPGAPWPDPHALLRYDVIHGRLGPALPLAQGMVVPTGFGICFIPAAGDPQNVATPGFSSSVVDVGGGMLWVADGTAGIARIALQGDRAAYLGSERIGTVRGIARAGRFVVAAIEEGAIVALEPDAYGRPIVRSRLVLDGRPVDVVADGRRWLAAATEAGMFAGTIDAAGDLAVRAHEPERWARRVAFSAKGPVAASATPTLWGSGLAREAALPNAAAGMAVKGDGTLLIAAGPAGLLALEPDGASTRTLRARPDAAAGVVAAADGDSYVSWSDGQVEQIDGAGRVLRTFRAGGAGAITLCSGGYYVNRLAADRQQVVTPDGATIDVPSDISDLAADGQGLLVAASSVGTLAICRGDSGWRSEVLRPGHPDGVRRAADGSLWIADEREGLLELPASGAAPTVHSLWTGTEATSVDVSEDGAVATSYFGADLLALPRTGAPVRALLPGRPARVLLRGDLAVVGINLWGLTVVPLHRGDWPEGRQLRLPIPRGTSESGRICRTDDGVLVALGEAGIADVRIDAHGEATLARIIDTPGLATDVSPGPRPGTWLVADGTDLASLDLGHSQ